MASKQANGEYTNSLHSLAPNLCSKTRWIPYTVAHSQLHSNSSNTVSAALLTTPHRIFPIPSNKNVRYHTTSKPAPSPLQSINSQLPTQTQEVNFGWSTKEEKTHLLGRVTCLKGGAPPLQSINSQLATQTREVNLGWSTTKEKTHPLGRVLREVLPAWVRRPCGPPPHQLVYRGTLTPAGPILSHNSYMLLVHDGFWCPCPYTPALVIQTPCQLATRPPITIITTIIIIGFFGAAAHAPPSYAHPLLVTDLCYACSIHTLYGRCPWYWVRKPALGCSVRVCVRCEGDWSPLLETLYGRRLWLS